MRVRSAVLRPGRAVAAIFSEVGSAEEAIVDSLVPRCGGTQGVGKVVLTMLRGWAAHRCDGVPLGA